jgi:hypothetical protein
VDRAELGARDERRSSDGLHVGSLVRPVRVHQPVVGSTIHLAEILYSHPALDDLLGDVLEVAHVEDAASDELLSVEITAGLPWSNGFEGGRIELCDEPLNVCYETALRYSSATCTARHATSATYACTRAV